MVKTGTERPLRTAQCQPHSREEATDTKPPNSRRLDHRLSPRGKARAERDQDGFWKNFIAFCFHVEALTSEEAAMFHLLF